ncbi:ATP-binding cassette domain-containing protein, partial [Sphaerotilus sp.]|uniref:ATP-binding cassette domain-containing protein n=1 Tax=Sphaerotilus sp. TaxID=2093942 RepID=UPI0034E20F62
QRLGGHIQEGKGLSIGYFAQQELDVLRLEEGPLAHMVRLARDIGPAAREQELRDFLGRFRFTGEMVGQAVGSLSGGEKARLVLAMLVWQRPNLLLMDEPTNHLDLTTREALSMALNEYEGTVMLVSHDRALLREVCDEFWLVTGGEVRPFDGDLDDYQKWLLEQSKEMAKRAREEDRAMQGRPVAAPAPVTAAPVVAAPAPSLASRDDRKAQTAARMKLAEQTKPLKKQQQQAEQALEAAQKDHARVLAALGDTGLSPTARAEQGRKLKELDDRIAELELRWMELGEQIEALGTA